MIDYYKILQLSPNATRAEIKAAYRRLSKEFHPDLNPDNRDAAARFRELKEAYEALMDASETVSYSAVSTSNAEDEQMDRETASYDREWYQSPAPKSMDPLLVILILIGGLVVFAAGIFGLMEVFYDPLQHTKTVILPGDSFVNELLRNPSDPSYRQTLDSLVNTLPDTAYGH